MAFINHLCECSKLRNKYFGVRHGESEANVAHVISSNPDIGVKSHGLSPFGRTQVVENTKLFIRNHPSNCNSYVIIASDFRRAHETAEIIAANLTKSNDGKLTVQLDQRLRERFFGIYDGSSDENYNLIWKNDDENPEKNLNDKVEPTESVRERTTALVKELEDKYENQTIFLISHGDAIQILQTAFERLPNATQQRTLKHLERAEFRPLILK
ncbi:unnamed protein product [Rotaria magnacalcarata]|uniref:Phosphoglycerate mutase n=1 Tax=Rotaria magnacalcarata TaxID=392030 RepID=A0A816RHX3_9BILA|nr:unnamed protein product [Rotaria magnacalcarata]CAF1605698.1 unnamed protein product [Rotaria magnacalcarata]CAF2073542.1 unnamed protein product [Rotaria magnacalcarata]CAF4018225.1 unnamed protein product [Rotaria magnacalcarata]CAF4051104.1 unnamed protein product [Rotaria magnacalcarata]